MRKLNIAILGTGSIAAGTTSTDGRSSGGHAPALMHSESAQLWSVLSRDAERARAFATTFNALSPHPAHTNIDTLLQDPELDAVIIATPDKLHAAQAVAAARAGKHVLLEKPMATDLQSAHDIVEARRETGVVLALAYRLRWHAGHRAVVAAAHDGYFGTIRHVRTHAAFCAADASNWRASSTVGQFWSLGALGTHCLDLIRWTLCESAGEIAQLRGVIAREEWRGPHDETAVASFKFESGATAELCSSVLFNAPSRFEIYGSSGWAICEDTFGRDGSGKIWTDKGPLDFSVRNPFIDQLDDFAQAIRLNRKPEVDEHEGARNVELLLRLTAESR